MMTTTTAEAPTQPATQQTQAQVPAVRETRAMVVDDGEFSMLLDSAKFAQLQRIGVMYARSKMVPAHFQGDEPSCMVAVQMAMRLNIDPFMFLQKTYVVGGKPGMEAPLVIALVNTRGPFKGPINWDLKRDEKTGEVMECTAYATHKGTGQVCSSTITWKMVEAEGWSKKNGSKWLTLREQMFKYRSAAFLARLYCPEVIMGMSTADELEEIELNPAPAAPEREQPRRNLRDRVVGNNVIDAGSEGGAPARAEPPQERARDSANGDKSTTSANETGARGAAPAGEAAELKRMGITVDEREPVGDAKPAAQGAAGATQAVSPVIGGAMPFDSVLGLAKKARSRDQGDIVLDALNGGGYTPEQVQQVKDILNSKAYNKEG
jgi:hypothetical protein